MFRKSENQERRKVKSGKRLFGFFRRCSPMFLENCNTFADDTYNERENQMLEYSIVTSQRQLALELANRFSEEPSLVIERAERYFAFLSSTDDLKVDESASGSKPEGRQRSAVAKR